MTPKAIRRRMIHDPGAQSPHARAGLAKKAHAQGTEQDFRNDM
jgi:hypothetical protein